MRAGEPKAPKVLYMLWISDAPDDETELDGRMYLREEEAIEHAKSVAGEMADAENGGKCAVYRCDLTKVGTAYAREAEYEAAS